MPDSASLLIVGASARAAAFSAVHAGYRPYWIDRYGDADLNDSFTGMKVTASAYPDAIPEKAASLPAMPFLYTGAMENHLHVIDALEKDRELLGNDAQICRAVRDPFRLQQCLRNAGLSYGFVTTEAPASGPGIWLCKPLNSAGGLGIRFHDEAAAVPAGNYLQKFIEGRSVSAVYIGDGSQAQLAGVTRQLVGKAAFHAARFSYCGSIGPLSLSSAEEERWRRIGNVLVETFGLRGLFGVDAVQRGDDIVPVEVNPRYTASVEVIEKAGDLPLMEYHVSACRGAASLLQKPADDLYGKCYLFAPERLRIRNDLRTAPMPCELDAVKLADIPVPGTVIEAGGPVLSLHTWGRDQLDCLQLLTGKAAAILETLLE